MVAPTLVHNRKPHLSFAKYMLCRSLIWSETSLRQASSAQLGTKCCSSRSACLRRKLLSSAPPATASCGKTLACSACLPPVASEFCSRAFLVSKTPCPKSLEHSGVMSSTCGANTPGWETAPPRISHLSMHELLAKSCLSRSMQSGTDQS